ncbi:hypothetical protein Q3G72_014444 [Acer saccharum]|nr:hypothetical protein Q3G72_014444 [Acer saccharum]
MNVKEFSNDHPELQKAEHFAATASGGGGVLGQSMDRLSEEQICSYNTEGGLATSIWRSRSEKKKKKNSAGEEEEEEEQCREEEERMI